MITDPIADFLTRIRNAQMAGHKVVDIPSSNLKKKIDTTSFKSSSKKSFSVEKKKKR